MSSVGLFSQDSGDSRLDSSCPSCWGLTSSPVEGAVGFAGAAMLSQPWLPVPALLLLLGSWKYTQLSLTTTEVGKHLCYHRVQPLTQRCQAHH